MSLTKVSHSMISGASVWANDYGMSTTATAAQNKAAFLAAFAAAGQGGCVNIPNGTYSIDGDIQLNLVGVTIQGAASSNRYNADSGFTGTELSFVSGTSALDLTQLYSDGATNSEFCTLRNLNIIGNNIVGNGVYIRGFKTVDNCAISEFTAGGVVLGGLVNSTIISQCGITSNGIGILENGVANTVCKVTECSIRQNVVGVKLEKGIGTQFSNCVIESNSSYGLWITTAAGESVYKMSFLQCWFENNGFTSMVQQVRVEGVDANPDIQQITFSDCTFDALNNTSGQDVNLLAGLYTVFIRCQFTNRVGISTGIVIQPKATYTSFYMCNRGMPFGQEFNFITNNGFGTYMQPLPQTYVGPNLQASSTWTNGAGAAGYSTFASTGNRITSAISTGGSVSATVTAGVSRSKGVSYVLQWIIAITSGQAPTITLTNGNNTTQIISTTVVGGNVERVYYNETVTGSSGVMTISNTAACNWSMSVNLIEYEVARGYIDLNAA